jgi:hypothetical protein
MRGLKTLLVAVTAAAALFLTPSLKSNAQVSIGVQFGPEPSCPYGYYDYAPYNCAPDGYYGPEWFSGGHFIGAGHWFHGPANFHGNVNNSFDPHHGYKGPAPARGEVARHTGAAPDFKGNESHDSKGHVSAGHK